MRILIVSDEQSPSLYDYFRPENAAGVDFILSAGDLKKSYLEFLTTVIPKPLFYVPGNHDASFLESPPEGCISLDGNVITYKGVVMAGLGGCRGTNPSEPFQLTETTMARRLHKLNFELGMRKLSIFVTHAPAAGLGDGDDNFHKGFECYRKFLHRREPALHIFGHQHKRYNALTVTPETFGKTRLYNACGYKIIDLP